MTDASGGQSTPPSDGFHATLPKRYVGAGLLLTDSAGRILLVEPTYKATWEIPGGVTEANESPPAAARRECIEELGIEVEIGRLLVVEHQTIDGRGDSTMLVYDGGDLADDAVLVLPPAELRCHRFVTPAELDALVLPRLATRVRWAVAARADGTVVELVDGDRVGAPPDPIYVVVSGPPGSGKSTLAPELARRLGMPLIAKDVIKDAMMSVLPVPDVEASRRIGGAAVAAMLAVAAGSPRGAVIESNFSSPTAAAELARLPGRVVEVFCRCDRSTAAARYVARAGTRHAGHFDAMRSPGELWNDRVSEPVAGGWPVIEVDSTHPVDIAALIRALPR